MTEPTAEQVESVHDLFVRRLPPGYAWLADLLTDDFTAAGFTLCPPGHVPCRPGHAIPTDGGPPIRLEPVPIHREHHGHRWDDDSAFCTHCGVSVERVSPTAPYPCPRNITPLFRAVPTGEDTPC